MGASKRAQMRMLDDDWPDKIWRAASSMNDGRGAAWLLPLAAIALTGCRPASLERGVTFAYGRDPSGRPFIEAVVPGSKITGYRGQPEYAMRWYRDEDTHRPEELKAMIATMLASPNKKITVRYDAEAISTRLRELSMRLWPRRRHAVTAYCYRHLMSATAKAAGVDRDELARAMGHRSTESAGRYARASVKTRSKRPFASVRASVPVRVDRGPMARFKVSAGLKRRMGGVS